MTCVIWNVEAQEDERTGDWVDILSTRVGGKYRVVGSCIHTVRALSIPQKLSLSRWITQQHQLGVKLPELHGGNLEEATTLPPLNFSDKVRVVLLYISKRLTRVDESFVVYGSDPIDIEVGALLSLAELHDRVELTFLVNTMRGMGLANPMGDRGKTDIWLMHNGWQRVEELTTRAADPSQAFVAMWFHPSTDAAYLDGIEPATMAAGYKPLRIDNKEHANLIHDEMIAEIRRSRFVVADFTCEPEKVRGSVYFEAGFALALNIPVIWTCREEAHDHLHFDTRPYNYLIWKDPPDLRQKLVARIGAVVGDGPLRR